MLSMYCCIFSIEAEDAEVNDGCHYLQIKSLARVGSDRNSDAQISNLEQK